MRPDGKPYANMFFFNGGMGAGWGRNGQHCLSWPSNVASTSVEVSEQIARAIPLQAIARCQRRYRPVAWWYGQEIEIESLPPSPLTVSFLAERTVIPAFGIQGGGAGATGSCGSMAAISTLRASMFFIRATAFCLLRPVERTLHG